MRGGGEGFCACVNERVGEREGGVHVGCLGSHKRGQDTLQNKTCIDWLILMSYIFFEYPIFWSAVSSFMVMTSDHPEHERIN